MQFQSTLPRRERRHPNRGKSAAICDFNPRSREGSDELPELLHFAVFISIHAPAKGATLRPDPAWTLQPISIHAPARGATGIVDLIDFFYVISIHAPARGATLPIRWHIGSIAFQSTLPRGERHHVTSFLLPLQHFNPRSREGSDCIY